MGVAFTSEDGRQYLSNGRVLNEDGQLVGLWEGDLEPAEADEDSARTEVRAATGRRRLANSYKPLFREALQRLVKREVVDMTKLVEKYLARRALPEFDAALKTFYDSWPLTVAEGLRAVTDSYAVLVNADAAEEIGQEADLTPELAEFVRSYLFEAGVEWSYSSTGQLRALAVTSAKRPSPRLCQRMGGFS